MKKKNLSLVFLTISAMIAAIAFSGCSESEQAADIIQNDSNMCIESCHSENTKISRLVLFAKNGYEVSGHKNGPRFYDSNYDYTGHLYVQHGSNAPYTARNGCSECHTHEGYVDAVEGVGAGSYEAASTIGCFTCHAPHENGNFGLRSTQPTELVTGTTFNEGKGNLCVQCHRSRRDFVGAGFEFDDEKSISSHAGPHHGPQAEMYLGTNHYAFENKVYYGVTKHKNFLGDSCVTCHHYMRNGGNQAYQLGGHGFYLQADIHGSDSSPAWICTASGCHSSLVGSGEFPLSNQGANPDIWINNKMATGDWDGDGNVESKTAEIRGLRDLLIDYFGDGAGNFGGNGKGGIVGLDGNDVFAGEWGKDWDFQGVRLTQDQARAYWNFKFFIEDKSNGVHNPTFAAQILYDSCVAVGIPVGSPRP